MKKEQQKQQQNENKTWASLYEYHKVHDVFPLFFLLAGNTAFLTVIIQWKTVQPMQDMELQWDNEYVAVSWLKGSTFTKYQYIQDLERFIEL